MKNTDRQIKSKLQEKKILRKKKNLFQTIYKRNAYTTKCFNNVRIDRRTDEWKDGQTVYVCLWVKLVSLAVKQTVAKGQVDLLGFLGFLAITWTMLITFVCYGWLFVCLSVHYYVFYSFILVFEVWNFAKGNDFTKRN